MAVMAKLVVMPGEMQAAKKAVMLGEMQAAKKAVTPEEEMQAAKKAKNRLEGVKGSCLKCSKLLSYLMRRYLV